MGGARPPSLIDLHLIHLASRRHDDHISHEPFIIVWPAPCTVALRAPLASAVRSPALAGKATTSSSIRAPARPAARHDHLFTSPVQRRQPWPCLCLCLCLHARRNRAAGQTPMLAGAAAMLCAPPHQIETGCCQPVRTSNWRSSVACQYISFRAAGL